jgi:hypothetical protein
MTITASAPRITCPTWCVYPDHEDADRPGGATGERYDVEFARGEHGGCFVHGSAESSIGGISVRLGASTTRTGEVVDDDLAVVVGERYLTLGQARQLAYTLEMYVDAAVGCGTPRAVQA